MIRPSGARRRLAAAARFFLILLAAGARAATYPIVSPPTEITDPSRGQQMVSGANPENSVIVRVGNRLFVVYQARESGHPEHRVFVRSVDLSTLVPGPAAMVDDRTAVHADPYHGQASLFRDRAGDLHLINCDTTDTEACYGQGGGFKLAPRYRVIRDLDRPEQWSPIGCLSSRAPNVGGAPGQRPLIADLMGVYDDRSGWSHLVGEFARLSPMDGRERRGLARGYFRIHPEGRMDGPYVLVDADCIRPTAFPSRTIYCGNIFTKGDIVLGKEPAGPRSLHLVWNIRHTFEEPKDVTHQWNYNLYYARSDDGGDTWRSLDGRATVRLPDSMRWDDSRYLAYQGDVCQDSERAFDVDSRSRPFMVIMRHRPGSGAMFGPHVDNMNPPRANPVAYDLTWQRWDGQKWIGRTINATVNWDNARPKVRIDRHDNIYVFVGDPPRYIVSRDGGQTWSRPVELGRSGGWGWRLYSYADPVDPDWHYIAFQHRQNLRLYLVTMRLTGP